MAKSKLKAMAESGNPWAIKTLRRAKEIGRASALRDLSKRRQTRFNDVVIDVLNETDRK